MHISLLQNTSFTNIDYMYVPGHIHLEYLPPICKVPVSHVHLEQSSCPVIGRECG